MFWKCNANSPSEVVSLLSNEDVTLLEVMDSEDIISECRIQNKSLIDFLQKPNIMEELVILTTNEPPIELEDHVRYKYPNIACELLTCDVPALNERLASDELLLDRLYHFLEKEPPLNPLLASFFSKIMGALIAKKTEQNWLSYQFTCLQVIDFLKAKDTFLSLLLKHIGTSAIMDLMLKLFTQVEGIDTKQNILNWLDSQQIIQSLVSMFNPSIDKDRHYNVAQLLCDFIRIARENQKNSLERAVPDPLLNTLESSEIVDLLLETIVSGEICESSTEGGIQVIFALLDVNQTSISKFNSLTSYNDINDEANDVEYKHRVLNNVTKVLVNRVGDFHKILLDPPKKTPLELTFGVLDPPLGQTRLQVLKLFVAVISSKDKKLLDEIISVGTFSTMLDLFFKYSWNNFLHTQVERCLVLTMKNYITEDSDETSVALCKHLIENCRLLDRILEAWEENEKNEAKGVRQGYMGHLINIMNEIISCCSGTYLGQFIKENHQELYQRLEDFKENTLAYVNETQRLLLGGFHPNRPKHPDCVDFVDNLENSIDSQQQQNFSGFQIQYLNSRYIDSCYGGYNDNEIIEASANPMNMDLEKAIDMDISDNTFNFQAFKQLCSQSINTYDDKFKEDCDAFPEFADKPEDQKDSDSDDDITAEDDTDPWSMVKNDVEVVAAPEDPWNSSSKDNENTEPCAWADFQSLIETVSAHLENFNFRELDNSNDQKQNETPVSIEDSSIEIPQEKQKGEGEGSAEQQITDINLDKLTSNEPSKDISSNISTLDEGNHDSLRTDE